MKRLTFLAGLAALLTAGTALAEPVILTLWHMEQPPHRVQRMQELIDAFNKANPGHRGEAGAAELGRDLCQGACRHAGRATRRTFCSPFPISRRS